MAPSEQRKPWRRWFLFCLAAVLGAAVVVMPALASSEGANVEARGTGPYEWFPASVSVQANGAVGFANPTATAHGIEWVKAPVAPHCSNGVPVGTTPGASGTKWSGSCTFAVAGEYVFYCTVHGPYMSGKVIVSPNGETTVTSTGTSTSTYPSPTTGEAGSTPYPAGAPSAGAGNPLALLAGSAANAVKVAARQRGHEVRGSVAIASAGEGARLEVDLLAHSAVPASGGQRALVRVGRLVVSHVHAGAVRFSVSISHKARKELASHGRLAVTVHITLQSASATPITLTRSMVLRP